jgi:hypothetical protein
MQLFNQTPLAARVDTSEVVEGEPRIGTLTAKATYKFDATGRVELDTQEPLPLFVKDEETPLGAVPADLEPRRDRAFEVILIGHAYAPYGRPVADLSIRLGVGEVERDLVVTGERQWIADGQAQPMITRPVPFTKMPLVYERAFGGKQLVMLDERSDYELTDRINPRGRGFDAAHYARELGDLLRAPPGYPRLVDYRRLLPNLEHPKARVAKWDDAPEPACWATIPIDVPLHASRRAQQLSPAELERMRSLEGPESVGFVDLDRVLYRAHPDWVIPIPPSAPTLRLRHLIDESADLVLWVPDQRVVADYVVEGRNGSRPLLPHRLVLTPDERRFTLLYRMSFTFVFEAHDERAFRLRIEPGWYSAEPLQ